MDEAHTVAEDRDDGARPDAAGFTAGSQLGRYIVLEQIGSGGMGIVYSAYDPELDRKIAVKLLKPREQGTQGTKQQRLRLVREAQAMARLSHPNVITVLDVGTIDGNVFIAMEFVDGVTLTQWIDEQRPWRQVVRVLSLAGRGLAAAHAAGLIHRDFKPDNVLVGRDGRVCVTDFGLAREVSAADDQQGAEPDSVSQSSPLSTPVTRTGAVLGTPAYMAPEQHQAKPTDARTDQFSFCVALYEALYREPPFPGDTAAEIGVKVLANDISPEPKDSDIPGWLRRIVVSGLSRAPGERHRSMEALLAELARDPSVARRRWLAVAVAVLVLAIAVIVVGLSRREASSLCTSAERDFDAVWTAERRVAAQAGFSASTLPYAQTAWDGVDAVLAGYRDKWTDMHTSACQATRERGVQSDELLDLRFSCLERRLREVDALARVLAAPDDKVIENSVHAARSLTSLDGCANTEALLERVPPPDDESSRARIAKIRDELADAKALNDAGKPTEAHALGVAAATEALEMDYAPLRAEALLLRGDLEGAIEDDEAAAQTLADAVYWAELARDDELAARAASLLIYVVGYKLTKFDRALFWSRYAESKVRRLGGADELEAARLARLGIVQQEKGDLDAALASYEGALALDERLSGPESSDVASMLASIAGVRFDKGDYAEALELYERSVQLKEVIYGLDHVMVAGALNNLGTVYNRLGRSDEAFALFERIKKIYERATGVDSPGVGLALSNMAGVYMRRGKYGDAEQALARSIEIYTRERGENHPDTAHSIGTLAIVYAMQGKLSEAEVQFRRVVAARTSVYGEDHAETAYAINNLGEVLLDQGKYDEALTQLERALELKEKHLGHDHPGVATTLDAIARVLVHRKRYDEAIAFYARSVAIREKAFGSEHLQVAEPLTSLGELYLGRGTPGDAVEPLERALRVREAVDDLAPARLAETRWALARALWPVPANQARSLELAGNARDGYAAAGEGSEDELAEVAAWLAARDRR